MNNNTIPSASIIPTAGYIPNKSKNKAPINKKPFIIAGIVFVFILIITAIIIVVINITAQSQNRAAQTEPIPVVAPTTPEPSSLPQQPEIATGNADYRQLVSKASTILSHGVLLKNNQRSFSARVYFTDGKLIDYFGKLSSDHKMAITATLFQYTSNPSLSPKQVANLGAESCRLLFNETDCKANKNTITPEKWRVINETSKNLNSMHMQYFGTVGTTSNQLLNSCPYYKYISEIDRYVYRVTCPKKKYRYVHFYQYKHEIKDKIAYLYFAGGSTTANTRTGEYTTLYRDVDAANLISDTAGNTDFLINSDNYLGFEHYRMTFKKENGNYIFQKFEITND
jgi:hypothetical protein